MYRRTENILCSCILPKLIGQQKPLTSHNWCRVVLM